VSLTAVIDSNVVIGLAKGGVFNHLRDLYTGLYVPPTVVNELRQPGQPGVADLQKALGNWITVQTPPPGAAGTVAHALAAADLEALGLARHLAVDHLLTGDLRLQKAAAANGVPCLGAPELVLLMKSAGCVTAVEPVLIRMERSGYGIAPTLFASILAAANE